MKDIENIEDWYRNEMENYHVTPDKEVWDALFDELNSSEPLTDDNISDWYKKEVEKIAERPDYTVWEKLSTRLDTATVWDKLVVSLNAYDQYIWWRNLVFRGTAIFVLLFGSYLAFQQLDSDSRITENGVDNIVEADFSTHQVTKEDIEGSESRGKSLVGVSNNKKNTATAALITVKGKVKTRTVAETYKTVNNNNDVNDEYLLASKDGIQKIGSLYAPRFDEGFSNQERDIERDINKRLLSEKDIVLPAGQKEFLVKKEKNKIVFNNKRFSSYFLFGLYARRFYVGLDFGVKKQTLINTIQKNPEFANYSQQYFLDFGSTIGATIGWIVSDKLNIESNVNFNSTSGYKRKFSSELSSFEEELNLNYTTISILAKGMHNKTTFDNKKYSTNLIGGIYAGQLTSATSVVGGQSSATNDYKKLDLGLVLGVEQDRYLTKAFVITPGIRYHQGLINIANDSSMFSSSRNFSLSFNLGIKYIFLKKG